MIKLPQDVLNYLGSLPAQCDLHMEDDSKVRYCWVNEEGYLEGVITGGKEGITALDEGFDVDAIYRIKRSGVFHKWRKI